MEALLIGILAVVVGLAFTFFGYRLFMILLPLWGAIVGFFFGAHLASVLFGTSFLGGMTSILFGILVAILFAIGAWLWYWLAVAVLAGSVGYGLGLGLMGYLQVTDRTVVFIAAVVLAVIFAIGAIWLALPRYLAIFLTGLGGAFTAVSGAAVVLGAAAVHTLETGNFGALNQLSPIWLIAAVVLAVVGIAYQVWSTSALEPIVYSRYRNPWWRSEA
jgi:uncharacterized protein DUF4203